MTKKFIAAVLERPSEPLQLKELEIPELQFGQVLVKVHFSGVCRSQLMEVRGERGKDPWLPHLLGHEGSGIVLAVGEGVTKVKCDDHVILGWIKGDGIDAQGARYISDGRIINSGRVTTFSTHTVVSESRLTLMPTGMDMRTAVLFGCAIPTGAGMVLNESNVNTKSTVAVVGLGGIGLSALMTFISLGCTNCVAIDISPDKLAFAKKLGADIYNLNSGIDRVYEELINRTNGGLDFCIESAGRVETIEFAFSILRKSSGKLVFASHPPDGEVIRLSPHELISGKKIVGSWGGGVYPDVDIPKIYNIMRNKMIPLDGLLTKSYNLAQINDALDDLEAGVVFRPLINMGI